MGVKPKLIGKILAYTREVKLKGKPDGNIGMHHFIYDNGSPFFPFDSPKIEWWPTFKAIKILEDIVILIKEYDPSFISFDDEELRKFIVAVLKKNALNQEIFNPGYVQNKMALENLFEARADKNPEVFSNKLLNAIQKHRQSELIPWIAIYSIPTKIESNSFTLGYEGISVIDSRDEEKWKEVFDRYSNVSMRHSMGEDLRKTDNKHYKSSVWIACELTEHSSLVGRESEDRVKIFFTTIICHYFSRTNKFLHKSMEDPWPVVFVHPAKTHNAWSHSFGLAQDLVYPLLDWVQLGSQEVLELRCWYDKYSKASEEKRKRLRTAALIIHSALIASDVIQFMLLFVSLDAMYGIERKVEKSIVEGVFSTLKSPDWREKASLIYNLRNALVHGEITSFEDWKMMRVYKKQFNSVPQRDIYLLVSKCFSHFFN